MKINYIKFMNLSKSDACIWCTENKDELKVDQDDPLFYMLVIGFLNWFDSIKGYKSDILTYTQLKDMFKMLSPITIKKILQQHKRFKPIKQPIKRKINRSHRPSFHANEPQTKLMSTQNVFKGLITELLVIHFWNHLLSSTEIRPPFLVKEGLEDETLLRRTFYEFLDAFLLKRQKYKLTKM